MIFDRMGSSRKNEEPANVTIFGTSQRKIAIAAWRLGKTANEEKKRGRADVDLMKEKKARRSLLEKSKRYQM